LKEDFSFYGDPEDYESYFAFDKEVTVPFDDNIISVENNIIDNTPNLETSVEHLLGYHVILEHENNEYSVIVHFKIGSLQVNEEDDGSAGVIPGLAGNSGNSGKPHIHFHAADSPDWENAS
jgi:hypothetical protein